MLEELNVTASDVFYDLGSGIGNVCTQVFLNTPAKTVKVFVERRVFAGTWAWCVHVGIASCQPNGTGVVPPDPENKLTPPPARPASGPPCPRRGGWAPELN